jgi:T5SS/PEP-CTERM-associated repeat protein
VACVNAAVGRQYNRDNLALLRDPGSFWRASGHLIVGNSGSGNVLLVTNGASLASGSGALDAFPLTSNPGRSNHVVITGAGSRWTLGGAFTLGTVSTHNSLTLADGGAMECASLQLGGDGASFSNFLIVAGGSLAVTNASGTAALDVNRALLSLRGGVVRADRFLADGGPASQVEFLAGQLRTAGARVANGLPFTVGNGAGAHALILDRGQHSFADGLVVSASAALAAAGTLAAAVTNAGALAIGSGVDSLVVTRELHLADTATLEFDLGGPMPGQFDFVQTTNTVRLGGALQLRSVNGYLPASNAVLVLMRFASASGGFANAPSGSRLALENSLVSCRVDYSGAQLQLSEFQNAAPATNRIDAAWAMQYFGHAPLSQAEEEADPDMDGASKYEEYVAGTHPTQAASVLRITSCTVNPLGHFVVQFLCVTGETYTIGFSTGLPAWTEIVPSTLTSPAPGVCEWIDDGSQTGGLIPVPGSPHRLYRIITR